MIEFFRKLFTSDFMPHGHCYLWQPQILWIHVAADSFITLSYYSIPLALLYLVRKRRDVAFEWVFVMFGLFIMACGTTHLLEIVTVWNPVYRLAGLIKAVTAVASVSTAAVLWGLMPRMVALPSPRQLRESNERLEKEIIARRTAEEALVRARDGLEERVRERTAELARTNDELRASQAQFQAILDYSPAVIFLKDTAGRYLLVNRAFETLFNRSNEELRGKTAADLLPPAEAEERRVHDRQVIESGRPAEVEEIVPQPDGPHTYLSIKFPLLGPGGAPYALCGISQDRTESKRVMEALQQAREEAERANAAKSEFLSRMSHELRTPLNAILGFGQVLEMDQPTAGQRLSIEQILKGGRHLLGLINEVLDIARVDAGRMSLSPEPVNADEVLQDSLNLLRPLADERRVRLEIVRNGTEESWVLADHQRLKQVLVNLLSNAVKFNRQGGSVIVSREPVADNSARLRIAVRDTGPGIAPADQGRLFQPFERLNADRDCIEGTGLGLALARRLMEEMGGRIGIESTLGEGSTFWIELPRVAPPEMPPAAASLPGRAVEASLAPRTVLYIEDNISNFKLIERLLLNRPDIRLLSAMQGSLGLELAREHRPDVILLDLGLPDLPGDEVLRRLRGEESTRKTPVLVISADAMPRQIEMLLAAGAHAYLTKPLDVPEFLRILDEQLGELAPAGG